MQRLSFVLVATWLLIFSHAQGQGADDQYVRIYNQMQEAEQFENAGQANPALAKYLECQTELKQFQRAHPDWNVQVVKFRLSYLESKIAQLSPKPAAAPKPASPASHSASAQATRGDTDTQIRFFNEQVRQLTAEKTLLEAKLKEALASQPSTMDPRELAKSEERVKTLQKENDLLKFSLSQAKAKAQPALEAKSSNSLQPVLAESNRKLAQQTEKADALALEKAALQKRLDSVLANQKGGPSAEASKKALDRANSELAEQKRNLAKLTAEKEALEKQTRAAKANNEILTAMQAENERLKKQLSDAKLTSRRGQKSTTSERDRELAQAKAQISTLQSDNGALRLEKIALENRLKQTPAAAPAVTAKVTPPLVQQKVESPARIKKLEQERDQLKKELEAALKNSPSRKDKLGEKRIQEMENQMAGLQARLSVFEARKLPYTPEELALFKAPDTKLAATVEMSATTGRKPSKGPPPGSGPLLAQAQRFFEEKHLDKAEEAYLRVLRLDDKNVHTLANLATIELEAGHLTEAEKHISQAMILDPTDSFSLSRLGYLRFKQQRYDEALDALSRAAKAEPENAEVQNYLGLTLSEKGMRGPAETALRKAIQIEPSYGSAHNNLAVIYLAQQPPSIELARWHYQKALAAGHPKNPELERMLDTKTVAEKGQ